MPIGSINANSGILLTKSIFSPKKEKKSSKTVAKKALYLKIDKEPIFPTIEKIRKVFLCFGFLIILLCSCV